MTDSTLDAFHRGAFWLVQPAHGGHRAGMDAMMLAASVPTAFAGKLADFGAGAGAAGLAVASRCPGATIALVENAPEMAEYARQTLALPENAAIAQRCRLIEADVTLTGKRRVEAHLPDNAFDFVIMNPPFNSARDRATPSALKQAAHVMPDGLFEAWVRSAAAIVKPRGGFAAIIRPDSLPQLLTAMEGRFGGSRVKPIHPRADEAAIRVIVRATRGSRAIMSLGPPLVMHEATSDRFSTEADALINGKAALFSD
jgi:tRNA1(Val) A37 N6-methylase TrmN6